MQLRESIIKILVLNENDAINHEERMRHGDVADAILVLPEFQEMMEKAKLYDNLNSKLSRELRIEDKKLKAQLKTMAGYGSDGGKPPWID